MAAENRPAHAVVNPIPSKTPNQIVKYEYGYIRSIILVL